MTYKGIINHIAITIFTIILFFSGKIFGQKLNLDSLSKITYKELWFDHRNTQLETNDAMAYAKAYLLKAKRNCDSLRIVKGYYLISNLAENEQAIKYSDSVLHASIGKINNHEYPARGYVQKGRMLYRLGKYKESLACYFKGFELAEKNNLLLANGIKFNIGLIKNSIGERKESLIYFKDYLKFLDTIDLDNKNYFYNRVTFAISDSYLFSGQIDSSGLYIDRGLVSSFKSADTTMYAKFLMNSGINSFFRDDYNHSMDSLLKATTKLNDHLDFTDRISSNLYIGKSLFKLDQRSEGVFYLTVADSLIRKSNEILPEHMDIYVMLKDYYKSIGESKHEMVSINNIFKYDSILDSNYKNLSENIVKNYEIPLLIKEKDLLITKLEKDRFRSRYTIIIILSLAFAILGLILFYFYNKNRKLKVKFERLMVERKTIELPSKATNSNNDLKISREVFDEVLIRLDDFEKSNKFINKHYTLNSLAKELNTNSAYLSKIVNTTKNVNFSNYLNGLRIDFAIKKLKKEKHFRLYTIKAIAEDCGFKNVQSFSLAFVKKTEIQPSYFIRQINKLND